MTTHFFLLLLAVDDLLTTTNIGLITVGALIWILAFIFFTIVLSLLIKCKGKVSDACSYSSSR